MQIVSIEIDCIVLRVCELVSVAVCVCACSSDLCFAFTVKIIRNTHELVSVSLCACVWLLSLILYKRKRSNNKPSLRILDFLAVL